MDVGEEVVGDRIVRDEAATSLGGLLSRRAVHAASRDEEDSSSSEMEPMAWEGVVLVRLSGRSDLPFIGAREGGERAATGGETRRGRRSAQPAAEGLPRSHANSTFAKNLFSFRVTFRIPVVRGAAWRAAEEERAWMSLLFSCSYNWGKNLPYKEVQHPLN